MPTMNGYKIFLALVEEPSFVKVAKRFHLTPSAISHAVKSLEMDLGTELFERADRKIIPNAIAKTLYTRIKPAISLITDTEKELRDKISNPSENLTIATVHTFAERFFLPYLPHMKKLLPATKIRIETLSMDGTLDYVLSGKADFGCLVLPLEPIRGIEALELFPMREVFVADRHLVGKKRTFSLEEIAKIPLISLPSISMSFRDYARHFESEGVAIEPTFAVRQMNLIARLVTQSVGVGIIYEWIYPEIKKANPDVVKLDVKPALPERKLALIRKKTLGPAFSEFPHLSDMLEYFSSIRERYSS